MKRLLMTGLLIFGAISSGKAANEEFEEVADKVELCALPAAIRNAYRRVIGKYRPQEEDGE